MNRAQWKAWYRQIRIIRRESLRATMDCIIFGAGCVFVSNDGTVRHIPAHEIPMGQFK